MYLGLISESVRIWSIVYNQDGFAMLYITQTTIHGQPGHWYKRDWNLES